MRALVTGAAGFVGGWLVAALRDSGASVVTLVEPVAAAVLAVLVLDERLGAVALLGGGVLLASVFLLAAQERRHEREAGAGKEAVEVAH